MSTFESINSGGANETSRILLIMYRISGSDFTYVKSVIAWLNYIIFNQTEGPSINCQIDNFASLTPSGTSAYQQDVRLTDQSPSSSSTNQSSLTGME